MAITFEKDLDALISLLTLGGYFVRTVQSIPESQGEVSLAHAIVESIRRQVAAP